MSIPDTVRLHYRNPIAITSVQFDFQVHEEGGEDEQKTKSDIAY